MVNCLYQIVKLISMQSHCFIQFVVLRINLTYTICYGVNFFLNKCLCLFKRDSTQSNLHFFVLFAEYGSAAGAGPVKKREHVVTRQIEQVHGRLTPRHQSCTSSSDMQRKRERCKYEGASHPATTPSLIVAAHSSLRLRGGSKRGCEAY